MVVRKPPRRLVPFPLPIQVGTDICHIPRIVNILRHRQRGPRFINRVLAPEERTTPRAKLALDDLKSIWELGPNVEVTLKPAIIAGSLDKPTPIWKAAEFIAGRFAAKEAAIKAHPMRSLSLHSIIIESIQRTAERGSGDDANDVEGGPTPTPMPTPPQTLTMQAIIRGRDEDHAAMISISHDNEYATATCLGYCPQAPLSFRPAVSGQTIQGEDRISDNAEALYDDGPGTPDYGEPARIPGSPDRRLDAIERIVADEGVEKQDGDAYEDSRDEGAEKEDEDTYEASGEVSEEPPTHNEPKWDWLDEADSELSPIGMPPGLLDYALGARFTEDDPQVEKRPVGAETSSPPKERKRYAGREGVYKQGNQPGERAKLLRDGKARRKKNNVTPTWRTGEEEEEEEAGDDGQDRERFVIMNNGDVVKQKTRESKHNQRRSSSWVTSEKEVDSSQAWEHLMKSADKTPSRKYDQGSDWTSLTENANVERGASQKQEQKGNQEWKPSGLDHNARRLKPGEIWGSKYKAGRTYVSEVGR